MSVMGSLYAILSNEIREILSYSVISQVGYIVAAIGVGTELALNGAAAHAYSHILYKSLLFMAAGAMLYAAGTTKLTELQGVGRRLPGVAVFYGVGALAIAGFPYLNGFTSV